MSQALALICYLGSIASVAAGAAIHERWPLWLGGVLGIIGSIVGAVGLLFGGDDLDDDR